MSKVKDNPLEGVSKPKLHAFLKENGGDGWTIWKTEKFTDMGFKVSDLPVHTYKSDKRDPKAVIFKDGKVVVKLTGVYNLSFLQSLAYKLNVNTDSDKMGRGSRARELTSRILEKLGK